MGIYVQNTQKNKWSSKQKQVVNFKVISFEKNKRVSTFAKT